jgi:hypothetical protein
MYYVIDLRMGAEGACKPPMVGDHTVFIDGTPLQGRFPLPLECATRVTGTPRFSDLLCQGIPVVSKRLAQALRDAGLSNIEEFPTELVNFKTNERWAGFLTLNIIGILKCVNEGESEGDDIGGGIVAYNKMVLKKSIVQRHLLFRVEEAPSTIVIHESVKNFLDAMTPPLTGISYIPVDVA